MTIPCFIHAIPESLQHPCLSYRWLSSANSDEPCSKSRHAQSAHRVPHLSVRLGVHLVTIARSNLCHQLALAVADETQDARRVALAMQQDQTMHPGVGEAARLVAIDPAAWSDAYLEILEASSVLLACRPEALEVLARGLEVEREAVPSAGQARGAR